MGVELAPKADYRVWRPAWVPAPGVARLKSIQGRQAVAATPPAALPGPAVNQTSQSIVLPFRRATVERASTLPSESGTYTAATQPIERTIEGTGFLYCIRLQMIATTSANAATVVFAEDAPWNALASIVLRDVNGEVVNTPNGWYLYLANLLQRNYANRWLDQSTISSLVTGVGAGVGGSFTQWFDVAVGCNRRDLLGVLGNQDRSQKYSLRTDIAPSTVVYTTPPTSQPTFTLNKFYESYSVPMPQGPNGVKQQVLPDGYGTIHFTTVTTSDATPLGGSTVNHYLRRIGNTVRFIALIFRSNSLRASADTNQPTQITFKVGDDTIFVETYAYRRSLMYERYGFDLPVGCLVYDTMHDFDNTAGFELGDDYYHTQALVNAQFQVAYPAGFAATGNSLTILTDDLIYANPA
jgi:hypothetical protein